MTPLEIQGSDAKKAARLLAVTGAQQKNAALEAMAQALCDKRSVWLEANERDIAEAKKNGMRDALLDRLSLSEKRVLDIASGIRSVASLPDPVGKILKTETRPNGLVIAKRTVPLGVIAMIYEARPNVTADAAALCLKSGNAVILRGGKEAINSNLSAVGIMRKAIASAGLPESCVSLVADTSHESAAELMHLSDYIDVLIPRGGAGLIRTVVRNAGVPVIRTGEGVCHIYVNKDADLDMAARILQNAKCTRPSVCNAAECVLIDECIAEDFLRRAVPLLDEYNVTLRCDEPSLRILGSRGTLATDDDWDSEYGDFILAVKTVSGIDEAVEFIASHGTGHSEAIVTTNYFTAQSFLDRVDAAAVYVNASTRFTDGGEFGLGAEIGISTQKMHARGPMGLEELCSSKYVIYGNGQIR